MNGFQVNLVDKGERNTQSHDIAKLMRPDIQKIASKYNSTSFRTVEKSCFSITFSSF